MGGEGEERGKSCVVMGLRATNITLETKYKQSGLYGFVLSNVVRRSRCFVARFR